MSRKGKKHTVKQAKSAMNIDEPVEIKTNKQNGEYIGLISEAPGYVVDNRHIFGGYRINYDTPKKIFRTLFMLHNESVNIWTHLFAAIVVLAVIGYAMFHISPHVVSTGNSIALDHQVNEHLESFQNNSFFQEITQGADEKLELLKLNLKDAYQDFINATSNHL